MPVFHTKTIESILDPVAQQVSRLVIIHEEGEAGHEMPDLNRPVVAVAKAVDNLVKVGREMTSSTEDAILKQDMPQALAKVGEASRLLEEAARLSQLDPLSQLARSKLIEGSRWILQGTSDVLLVFDESEVRKIVAECKRVLDYLSVAEVIETMEDLVQFVKDLSPCLSKVTREVTKRTEDLTHQVHREILSRCCEQVKTLAPILICSMKIFIQLFHQGGKGVDEAGENRNYLSARMIEEVNEMIRVLQLTTYDEDEWDTDNITVMKRALNLMESNMTNALDWLHDPNALSGGVGEKCLARFLEQALKVSERSLPADSEHLRRLSGHLQAETSALSELRRAGATAQAEALAKGMASRLHEALATAQQAISRLDKAGIAQPAHTVAGRLDQARRWLEKPTVDDRGLGRQAVALVIKEGKKMAEAFPDDSGAAVSSLCDEIETNLRKLSEYCESGDSDKAAFIAHNVADKLNALKFAIGSALVQRVVQDLMDTGAPLRHFADCVLAPKPDHALFDTRAEKLRVFSARAVQTANMVAAGSTDKRVSESLQAHAAHLEALTPQLVHAGRIRLAYPESKAADEHFANLRAQFGECVTGTRTLCDVATDSLAFVRQSAAAMDEVAKECSEAVGAGRAVRTVECASALARMAARVAQVGRQEAENSEDARYSSEVASAAASLQDAIAPMVEAAKAMATDITNKEKMAQWEEAHARVFASVVRVADSLSVQPSERPPIPPYPRMDKLSLEGGSHAPPRPPPPQDLSETTDEESEDFFLSAPTPSQGPIMLAAHDLHQEVKQWSSKDNDVIAAAKRMALLMAQLSQLVAGSSAGDSKRQLISCAREIAEASQDVTDIAKELAKECTDKRMRTSLLQVCERIPTIATQLKILSTVKATMLGAQGTEEDEEATEMLVGNAQNLMQSVKHTVTAAEAASIKIRTDAGIRLKWIRKQPWYQY